MGESYNFRQVLGYLCGAAYEDFCGQPYNDLIAISSGQSKTNELGQELHKIIVAMKQEPKIIAEKLYQLKGKEILSELLPLDTQKAIALIEFYTRID